MKNRNEQNIERILPLAEAACLGTISKQETESLQEMLRGNAERQRIFLEYCRLHSELRCLCRASAKNHAVMEKIAAESDADSFSHYVRAERDRPKPSFSASIFGLLGGAYQEHNVAFSYMAAVVLLSVAAVVGSMVYVSSGNRDSLIVYGDPSHNALPEVQNVGRITGMKDCLWTDPNSAPYGGSPVSIGRQFILNSGLLEITYDTGARVILEGPCSFVVDSDASGYLRVGKLVARVEKNDELRMMINELHGRDSDIHHSSFINHPLFSVRTPTATITDLGTEFGVEVSANGNTISHVFQGLVRVEVAGKTAEQVVLHENETAHVITDENGARISNNLGYVPIPEFVRSVRVVPNRIDLLDIVAGGDGTGNRRERGIDPISGKEDTSFFEGRRGGDDVYRRIAWHPLIDGVFVPNGVVQVDSTGGEFAGFPATTGETSYSIWARAADVEKQHNNFADRRSMWIYHILHGERYMPEGGGLLAMHSNTGITFDLHAIRSRYGAMPVAFRATAALADRPPTEGGWADVWKIDAWVIVDGNLRFKREGLRMEDGPVKVNFELGPNDRFLTLAVTDHDRDSRSDCGIFGAPMLEMKPAPINR